MTTKKNPDSTPRNRAIQSTEVAHLLGMGRTSFLRLLTLDRLPPSFPPPLITTPGGPQRTGRRIWLEADIKSWIAKGGRI